jgi:hypothetical protein
VRWFVWQVFSAAVRDVATKTGIAMATMIPIMRTTTMSSTRVKPSLVFRACTGVHLLCVLDVITE